MEESPAEKEDEQVEADEEREVTITKVTAITGRGPLRAWYPEITVVSWWMPFGNIVVVNSKCSILCCYVEPSRFLIEIK